MKRLIIWLTCWKFGINFSNYTINKDFSIDVYENIYVPIYREIKLGFGTLTISVPRFDKLPIKFNIVHGDFICKGKGLSSFENFPKIIYGRLDISNNKFTSMIGCPDVMYDKPYHYIINCNDNNILSFEGFPITKSISFLSNPICKIYNYLDECGSNCQRTPFSVFHQKSYDPILVELFNDYDIIRGNEVSKYRFDKFLEDNNFNKIGDHQLRIFKGYKLI